MTKYRSTLIVLIILSIASFFPTELTKLAGDMGLYIGVVQFNNQSDESIKEMEFYFEPLVGESLMIYEEPIGWSCYKEGTTFHFTDGILAPRESITIQLSCYQYFPNIQYPFIATGYTESNAAISGDGVIKFNDFILLRILYYISRSPNQTVLLALTGVFILIELIDYIRHRNDTQPKPPMTN